MHLEPQLAIRHCVELNITRLTCNDQPTAIDSFAIIPHVQFTCSLSRWLWIQGLLVCNRTKDTYCYEHISSRLNIETEPGTETSIFDQRILNQFVNVYFVSCSLFFRKIPTRMTRLYNPLQIFPICRLT